MSYFGKLYPGPPPGWDSPPPTRLQQSGGRFDCWLWDSGPLSYNGGMIDEDIGGALEHEESAEKRRGVVCHDFSAQHGERGATCMGRKLCDMLGRILL